jgi:hypothetical protein
MQNLPIEGTEFRASDVADYDHVCGWCTDNIGLIHPHPGSQAYYNSLLSLFASWGVDYVKADDMGSPYRERED